MNNTTQPDRYQQPCSCVNNYEQDDLDQGYSSLSETIDEKIERIRRELRQGVYDRQQQLNGRIEHHIHYSTPPRTPPRTPPAPREPWRSSNQSDYPWRDAHLPAYRDVARSQTALGHTRTWNESAHARSHRNTDKSNSYYNRKDYVYRPKSEAEARKWYTQTTGKDPDREVYQALRGGTTTYEYKGPSVPYYDTHQGTTKTHTLKQVDSTQHNNIYASNDSSLHIVPKQSSSLDPPYMKIINAPVTYLH